MFGLTPYRNNRNNRNEMTAFNQWNNPWRALEEFEKGFFDMNNDFSGDMKVDIKYKGNEYLLEADMPGFEKENISVDIENGYLTISGERRSETEDKNKKDGYVRCERSYGMCSRSFDISDVKEDQIKAEYKNGVLKLTMPKKDGKASSSRRLEIE